jgi:hypothetical protein
MVSLVCKVNHEWRTPLVLGPQMLRGAIFLLTRQTSFRRAKRVMNPFEDAHLAHVKFVLDRCVPGLGRSQTSERYLVISPHGNASRARSQRRACNAPAPFSHQIGRGTSMA